MQDITCNVGDKGSIPGSGRSPEEGNGNSPPYFCLGNPTDRGAWRATAHGVTKVRRDLATKLPPPPPPQQIMGRVKSNTRRWTMTKEGLREQRQELKWASRAEKELETSEQARKSALITFTQHCTRGLSQCKNAERRNKRDTNWNGKKKIIFTHNDMIVSRGYPKQCKKKLLELINGLSKFTQYNIKVKNQL